MARPDEQQTDHREGTASSRLTWLVPLGVIGALLLLCFTVPAARQFVDEGYAVLSSGDRARTEEWVSGFGAWGPAAILAFMIAQTVIPVIPSVLIMVVAVLAYGPLFGGTLTYVGLLLAASVAYGIGRALGPVTVDRLIGHDTEQKLENYVNRYGVWAVVVARISPIVSTDAVSLVAGLSRMGFWRFLLATAAGTLPLVVLVAYLGADIDRLQGGLIWVSVISILALVAYVVYDQRRKRQP